MDKKSLVLVGLGQLIGAAGLVVSYLTNKHQEKLIGEFIDKKFEEHENKAEEES